MKEISVAGNLVIKKLKKVSIFANASEDSFLKITGHVNALRKYNRKETIYSPDETNRQIIIFLSGSASAYSIDDNRNILLRSLFEGDVIGVANLFTCESYVSRIIAVSATEVISVSENLMKELLETDKNIMYGYIKFLSERICYLNKKITILTAGSAERRLSYLIDYLAVNESVVIPFSASSTAEMLNIGRASLYRAYEKLESDGFIKRNGKEIILLDRQGMLENYK